MLDEDDKLSERTNLSVDEIIEATKLCLTSTLFKFKGDLYQQTDGVAMGSPISPIVANLFMQELEQKVLMSFSDRPRIWWRYVDDTLVVIRNDVIDSFLQHLNSYHPRLKFTMERETIDREISFLDCKVQRKLDGTISTGIYRKGTHSNRYLSFKSEHPMCTKKAVASSLFLRAKRLTSSVIEHEQECKVVRTSLKANGYTDKLLDTALKGITKSNTEPRQWTATVVIPYRRNTSEDLRRVLNQYNIRVAFQSSNMLRKKLVHLKEGRPVLEQSNCVYQIRCNDCEACYIGQTARQLETRVKEHERCSLRPPKDAQQLRKLEMDSAIAAHAIFNHHQVDFEHPTILQRGFRNYKERLVSEALLIAKTPKW